MIHSPRVLAILAVIAEGLIGHAVLLVLVLRPRLLKRGLLALISFAAGALLGDAFIHLIPEISRSKGGFGLAESFELLGGVIAFFILEKVLHWHHAHVPHEEVLHPVAISNLVGNYLHNFVDGAIIAGSFLVSRKLGFATAVAIALHEIPQEMGDFSILVHAGLKPWRALLLNSTTALAALAGTIITLLVSTRIAGLQNALVAITAGGFVYIASTDLIPELHKEPEAGKSVAQLASLLFGVGVMAALRLLD